LRHFIFIAVIFIAFLQNANVFAGSTEAVETTLYFGLDLPDGGVVSEEQWAGFLADIVTPRFPEGFTVLDAQGQWRDPENPHAGVLREATRVMIIVHTEAVDADRAISEIKSLYKTSFGQKSVFHTEAQVRLVE
jgi:hypothetical protein